MTKLLILIIVLMSLLNMGAFYKLRVFSTPEPPEASVGNSIEIQHFGPPNPPQVLPESTPEPKVEPKPEDPLTYVEVPKFRESEEDSIYGDVMAHSKLEPFGNSYGRATNVHETAHGIHSLLRNKYKKELGKEVNGFYCLKGRGFILEEPKILKSDIGNFVPKSMQRSRFFTYIVGSPAWEDVPLYIYDEWIAYVLGAKTNVDDVQNGMYKGQWTDGVFGSLEFSVFATALCMAVKEKDPSYWESNPQFKRFTIGVLKEAHKNYMLGSVMEEFKWDVQDKYLNNFLTNPECENIRNFMREHLDGDNHWLKK